MRNDFLRKIKPLEFVLDLRNRWDNRSGYSMYTYCIICLFIG